MNQPPIQFPQCPNSPIRNDYNNSSSSQVGNGVNDIEVGMDDYLWDTTSMDIMLLYAFRNDEQGDDAHIIDTLFESLKSTSTTCLFGLIRSNYTQMGTKLLMHNLKEKFGMSNTHFSKILR